jgi:hypothetical protein
MKNLIAAVASAALLTLTPAAVSAQQASPADLQKILQKVEEAVTGKATPRATVARSGRLRVTATFTKKQAFTGPARCTVNVFHRTASDQYAIQRSMQVPFSGNTQACSFVIDYDWPEAESTFPVTIGLQLDNSQSAGPSAVTIMHQWPKTIPLPAGNGGTTVVAFGNLDI